LLVCSEYCQLHPATVIFIVSVLSCPHAHQEFHKHLNYCHFRSRNTLSKGKGTQVVFSRSKPHFMSQMSRWLIQSLGTNTTLDNVCFLFTSPSIKSFPTAYCRKPCKIGYKYLEDGTKVRYARGMYASGVVIPRPEILKERRKPRPTSRKSHKKNLFTLIIW
jgi:hypothetical protein